MTYKTTLISPGDMLKVFERCSECKGLVYTYACNERFVALRPEAAGHDFWISCGTETCKNHYGQVYFQDPEWLVRVKMVQDLKPEEVKVGLKIKGISTDRIGTVTQIDHDDDDFAWVQWNDEEESYSGFYGNNCPCEVVED